jgi:asparagine synthase (glutamine-hydrolysing)
VIYHLDYPVAGPGAFPQFMVSAMARKHRKVVLGGQGGDELFGGYARYLIAYFEQCLKAAIDGTMHNGNFVVTYESILPNLTALQEYKPLLTEFWRDGLFESMDRRYFRLITRADHLRDVVRWDILGDYSPYETFRSIFQANNLEGESYFDRMTHFDFKTLLPALLQVEDRVSMAVSLESRVPLLDYRVAELAASMPPSIKFAGGRSKNALKEAMKSTLPEAILNRQDKMGFPVPLSEWLRGPAREFVSDTLLGEASRSRGLFDPKALQDLMQNETKYGREIWGALCLELWFQAFLDAGSETGASSEAPVASRSATLRVAH